MKRTKKVLRFVQKDTFLETSAISIYIPIGIYASDAMHTKFCNKTISCMPSKGINVTFTHHDSLCSTEKKYSRKEE